MNKALLTIASLALLVLAADHALAHGLDGKTLIFETGTTGAGSACVIEMRLYSQGGRAFWQSGGGRCGGTTLSADPGQGYDFAVNRTVSERYTCRDQGGRARCSNGRVMPGMGIPVYSTVNDERRTLRLDGPTLEISVSSDTTATSALGLGAGPSASRHTGTSAFRFQLDGGLCRLTHGSATSSGAPTISYSHRSCRIVEGRQL